MKSPTLPLVSEIVNGNWSILAFIMVMICATYISHEYLVMRRQWTQGMSVAMAVMVLSIGVFVSRAIIYVWRHFYGAATFTDPQLMGLTIGGAIGAIGFLLAIREYSRPFYGERVWMAALASVVIFTIYTLTVHA